ncbi:MAG: hypothetical protein HFH76_03595 [Lachnospiraceae bacterium]|nr:hypothetical protein [Lachnospiraceae bacterium]
MEEPVTAGERTGSTVPMSPEDSVMSVDVPVMMEEINIDSLEIPETPDLEIPDLEIPDLDLSDLDLSDIVMPGDAPGAVSADTALEEMSSPSEEPIGDQQLEDLQIEDLQLEDSPSGDLQIEDLQLEDLSSGDLQLETQPVEEPQIEAFQLEDLQLEAQPAGDFPTNVIDVQQSDTEEPNIEEPNIETPETDYMEMPEMPDSGEGFSLEDIDMPDSDSELKLEDIDIPGMSDDDFLGSELSIDGLDEAIQSETERQMAGELNIDELEFDNISAEAGGLDADMPDLTMPGDSDSVLDASISMDDNLEDVLNMLDDDAELAEINDMLKKSDNNEPIQDDMMDLLHQMADDEAASVNAGINRADDDDDGVPLPDLSQLTSEPEESEPKKKDKKAAKKKKADKEDAETAVGKTKEPGRLGKFFNLLTEEFVPEPTEEELAAEKEAKAAKKQENLTRKEEEKLAREEAKKAKAEEKAAADRVKQEAAAQKKKEKLARKEAKKAKLAAEGPKKRIPPKKIAVAAAFGASVGGAIVLASNVLSTQGFLQTAKSAYYDGDYKTVYEATYGMELDDSKNEGLIQARSKVIYTVQRRLDSYQIYIKTGRELEALDALLRGITAYDSVNADAERYEVMEELDAVKAEILDTLSQNYGLDETEARAVIANQDAVSYTIALREVIAGN